MVNFKTTISKSSNVYLAIEEAVHKFQELSDESFSVFGTITLDDQEFIGGVFGKADSRTLAHVLSSIIQQPSITNIIHNIPAAPPQPMMTAKAGGCTYVQMVKAGWTDALMIEHGYLEDDIPF